MKIHLPWIHGSEKVGNDVESDRNALMDECFAYDNVLRKNGHWVARGEALQSARNATTLRWKKGSCPSPTAHMPRRRSNWADSENLSMNEPCR